MALLPILVLAVFAAVVLSALIKAALRAGGVPGSGPAPGWLGSPQMDADSTSQTDPFPTAPPPPMPLPGPEADFGAPQAAVKNYDSIPDVAPPTTFDAPVLLEVPDPPSAPAPTPDFSPAPSVDSTSNPQ